MSQIQGYAAAFLNCGGIGEPPYVVKWRGRWWRTHWVAAPQGYEQASPKVLAFVRSLGPLPFGLVRWQDYKARTRRVIDDLPLIDDAALAAGRDRLRAVNADSVAALEKIANRCNERGPGELALLGAITDVFQIADATLAKAKEA